MLRYSTKDEILSFAFHDSILKFVNFCGSDMVWEIKDCVVLGNSCPDIPNRTSNSLNSGEDRYVEPILILTFQNCKIGSMLRGGCWTVKDNVKTEAYPPMLLKCDQYIGTLQDIANDRRNTIYEMNVNDKDENRISFDIWGGTDPQYYTIELQVDHIVTEWDSFGKEAWYLEHYRNSRKSE